MITAVSQALDFSPSRVFSEPFLYAISSRAFKPAVSLAILEWLEREAPWRLVETDFYEQFEFSIDAANTPEQLMFLAHHSFLDALRVKVQEMLRVTLAEKVDATAHRLVPGQRIRIHNDFQPTGETHRLLIQLNREWRNDDGGFLLFFRSQNPADVHRVFLPVHNSAIAFAISRDSNHAVTTIHGGQRFTLVYSFRRRDDTRPIRPS